MTTPRNRASEPYLCLFCNEAIDESERCEVNIRVPWSESDGYYWCHPGCLQSSVHPSIPLYLLSLRDSNDAVYGTKPIDG